MVIYDLENMKNKFEQYSRLVEKPSLSDDEICEIAELEMYLDENMLQSTRNYKNMWH